MSVRVHGAASAQLYHELARINLRLPLRIAFRDGRYFVIELGSDDVPMETQCVGPNIALRLYRHREDVLNQIAGFKP